MKKNISLVAGALLVALLIIVGFDKPEPALGAGGLNTSIDRMTVSTGVMVNTTSTLLLATSTARQYAVFGNLGSSDVFLALTKGNAAVKGEGVRIPPGGSYVIADTNLYTGAIYAIASTTAATTTVAASQ